MIAGIGMDIVEIERIARLARRHERLAARLLTPREMAYLESASERRRAEFLAGRFAAKEAAAKALGTGIGKTARFHDLEILPDAQGRPRLLIAGRVLSACSLTGAIRTHVSISHSRDYAAAQVIIEQV